MAMEGILVTGVTEILKPLISLISQQISLARGAKDDLRKLKDTLESIQALITDAEEKQVHDAAVRLWLKRLKDVVYDADDVMDEFIYETMRSNKQKVQALVSSSNESNTLVFRWIFRFKMARKIRAINQRLDEIFKNSKRYMLRNTGTSQENQNMDLIRKRNRLTSWYVDDSLLLGREGAKSDIINLFIDKPSASVSSSSSLQPEIISTLSIVGIGGLGKTTVAQMVYQDDYIVRNFERRAWVCVSDTFDIFKILKDIIESITGRNCENTSNIGMLTRQVKELLIGRKYLLVLDNLRNENRGDWGAFKSFLNCGGSGSKILITARSKNVGFSVGGAFYNLNALSDDLCWSIIEKKLSFQGGAALTPEMINIGKALAKSCGGLPLAANLLGSLMFSKREQSYWLSIADHVRTTPAHERIMFILKLSYDNLPSPLKQCFLYCCIFPKDCVIHRETLIQLWMAEGFLFPSGGGENISFEDIGNEYFEHLMWSSFFQDGKKDAESGYIATCKMHDYVRDLAMSLLDNNELGTVKVGDRNAEVSQVRRLQMLFNGGRSLEAPKGLSNVLKLRTIIAVEPYTFPHINSFFRSKRLRILCLCPGLHSGWRGCSLSCGLKSCKLCFASSKLKYLRYLDLSYLDLSRGLSLNYSYNLQTLVLRECKNVPSWLLSKIGTLKSLRHVDVSYSDIKFIPQDIGLLEHLSCIDLSGTSISELPDSITCISSLRTLKIYACRNLNALPRELGALTQLRFLDLNGTKIKELPKSCINIPCNLEIVKLGYGCELPKEIKNWPKLRIFTHNSYSDAMPRGIERLTCLERLEDYIVNKENEICGSEDTNCSSGSGIEELAGLNTLEVLTIRNLENVRGQTDAERACLKGKQCIRVLHLHWSSCRSNDEDSMVLEGLQPHSNLKELKIQRFQGSKLPYWMGLSYCLPNLVELCLFQCDRCDKLAGLGLLPCLRVIHIKGMNSVKILGKEFYYHEEGESSSSSVSTTEYGKIFLFPSLNELSVDGMESLVEWVPSPPPPYYSFPLLKSLSIKKCQRLKTTPNSFPSLESLELEDINDRGVRSFLASTEGLTSLTSISYPGRQSNFRC